MHWKSHKEVQAGLVQQEFNNMKIKKLLWVVVIAAAAVSCSTPKQHTKMVPQSRRSTPQIADRNEIQATSTFIDATSAFITGNDEKAEKLYLEVLEKRPNDHAAMYQLARVYFHQENITKAEEYGLKAYNLEKHNQWYIKFLSEVYQVLRKYDESAKMVEKLTAIEPSNAEYRWQLGNLYIFSEQYAKAIEEFDAMEEILGINEEISQRKIKVYEHLGKKEKALDEIRSLVEFSPREVRYRAMLAEKLMKFDRPDEAYIQYQEIAKLNPSDPYIHITLAEYYRKKGDNERSFEELKKGFSNPELDIDTKIQILITYYSVTEIYQDLNPQAYELLKQLVQAHPDDPKAWSMYGDFLYRDEKRAEAADAYLKVLEYDKSKYVVWESLMHALLSINDYERLQKVAEESMELFPYQPMPLLFAGFSYMNSKSYSEAIKVLKTGVGMVVDNPVLKGQFFSSLGDSYHALNRLDDAFEAYDKSLLLDPENSYVLNNYSYYLSLEKRDLEKAEIMAKKAVELDPENPNNLDTYGWVLYQLGNYEEAEKYIFKSLKKRPHPDPEIFEHYADVLYRLNKTEKAVEYWQKAIDAGGNSEALIRKAETGKMNDNE